LNDQSIGVDAKIIGKRSDMVMVLAGLEGKEMKQTDG